MVYVYWLVGIFVVVGISRASYAYLQDQSNLKCGLKGRVAKPDDYYRFRDEVLNMKIGTEYYGDRFFVTLDPHEALAKVAQVLGKIGFPDIKREKSGAQNTILIVFVHEGCVYRLCFNLDVSVWLSGQMPDRQRSMIMADISSYISSYQKMTKTQRMVRAAEEELGNGVV